MNLIDDSDRRINLDGLQLELGIHRKNEVVGNKSRCFMALRRALDDPGILFPGRHLKLHFIYAPQPLIRATAHCQIKYTESSPEVFTHSIN